MRARLPSPVPTAALALALTLANSALASPPAGDPAQPDPGNCWIWGAASLDGQPLPGDELLTQLCDGPSPTVAQQAMGEPDGWSLAAWPGDAELPSIVRDPDPIALDEEFAGAAEELAAAAPSIALAHFRNTSSGCTPEEGNPHPFLRTVDGAPWLLQHNGTVNRSWLQALIGPAYLAEHPPLVCPDDPVDSELILILLAHRVEHRCDDQGVADALREGLVELTADMAGNGANLMITDGARLWALRAAHSDDLDDLPLRLRVDESACWIDKEAPNRAEGWVPLDDLTLVTCDTRDGRVEVAELDPIFDLSIDLDGDGRWCEAGAGVEPGQVVDLRLRYLDPREDEVRERNVWLTLPAESPLRDVTPTPDALSTDGGLSWNVPTAGGLIGNSQVTHLRWDLGDTQQRLVVTALVEASCTDPAPLFTAHWADEGGAGGNASSGLTCDRSPAAEPQLNTNPDAGCRCGVATGPSAVAPTLATLLLFLRIRRRT